MTIEYHQVVTQLKHLNDYSMCITTNRYQQTQLQAGRNARSSPRQILLVT